MEKTRICILPAQTSTNGGHLKRKVLVMVLARSFGNYHVVLYVHPVTVVFRCKMQETILTYQCVILNDCMIDARLSGGLLFYDVCFSFPWGEGTLVCCFGVTVLVREEMLITLWDEV